MEYTWPNFGNPTTGRGTILIAHRGIMRSVTVLWDEGLPRKMWWQDSSSLKKVSQ